MMKGLFGMRVCLLDSQEFLFLFHFSFIDVGIDAFFDEGEGVGFGDFEKDFVHALSGGFFVQFD